MRGGDHAEDTNRTAAKPREELQNVAKNIADCTGGRGAFYPKTFRNSSCHQGLQVIWTIRYVIVGGGSGARTSSTPCPYRIVT